MTVPRAVALVLAAGKGSRFGASKPKQLLELAGRPVFSYALHQHLDAGHQVIAVVSEVSEAPVRAYVDEFLPDEGIIVVTGGETRRESILAAIAAIPNDTDPKAGVILRNAASPNTPNELIEEIVEGLLEYDGMQAFIPSNETAFLHTDGHLEWLYDRATMGFTVDPTAYRYELISRVADTMRSGEAGDTSLDIARKLGASIGLVKSPATNIKLTTPGDWDRLTTDMRAHAADRGN